MTLDTLCTCGHPSRAHQVSCCTECLCEGFRLPSAVQTTEAFRARTICLRCHRPPCSHFHDPECSTFVEEDVTRGFSVQMTAFEAGQLLSILAASPTANLPLTHNLRMRIERDYMLHQLTPVVPPKAVL